jgi:hypothetical protein
MQLQYRFCNISGEWSSHLHSTEIWNHITVLLSSKHDCRSATNLSLCDWFYRRICSQWRIFSHRIYSRNVNLYCDSHSLTDQHFNSEINYFFYSFYCALAIYSSLNFLTHTEVRAAYCVLRAFLCVLRGTYVICCLQYLGSSQTLCNDILFYKACVERNGNFLHLLLSKKSACVRACACACTCLQFSSTQTLSPDVSVMAHSSVQYVIFGTPLQNQVSWADIMAVAWLRNRSSA